MGRLAGVVMMLFAGLVLVACAEPRPGDEPGASDDDVLMLGKRSAPWPDEVARATDDGLVEVLETDAVVEEAWAALAPDELPAGGDASTSVEEGAHLPPDQLGDRDDRVIMRVRHVESSTCPVRIADLSGDGGALALEVDDGGARDCTDDANPFTALIAVDAAQLPPLDQLPDEVARGEHWTLQLRRVAEVDDLAGTTDPARDTEPRLGGFELDPDTLTPGDELTATFPAEDPGHDPDDAPAGAPAPHERGVAFPLERRVGDTWVLEAYLVSDRDADGPRVALSERLPEELVDDPDPDRLVVPDDAEPGPYRLCTLHDRERCAHLEITP